MKDEEMEEEKHRPVDEKGDATELEVRNGDAKGESWAGHPR
jgi:hypothetical protein